MEIEALGSILATQVFEYLDLEVQKHFLTNLTQEKITDILNVAEQRQHGIIVATAEGNERAEGQGGRRLGHGRR